MKKDLLRWSKSGGPAQSPVASIPSDASTSALALPEVISEDQLSSVVGGWAISNEEAFRQSYSEF